MRWLWVLALVSSASAAPRSRPFVQTPGIALGKAVNASAFCEASQRAVFRLFDGNVISVGTDGVVKQLGMTTTAAGVMACDRNDRVAVTAGIKMFVLANGQVTQETMPFDVRYVRTLDDGAFGLVDVRGNVYRYTTSLQQTWTAGRPLFSQFELDGAGEQILQTTGSRIEITDRNGKREGPAAITGAWLDNRTIVFGDRTGMIGRWPTDQPTDKFTQVVLPKPNLRSSFIRTMFQSAGKRMIMHRNDGPIHVATFDAQGIAKTVMISRIPSGRRTMASGDAPFAFIAVNDRAVVVDLTRHAFVIDHDHPLGAVDAMAFSPDGRELAMLGGDRDILIASLDGKRTRRLTTTQFVRAPLQWAPDGTLIAGTLGAGHLRFSLDGTLETRKERTVGFTPTGGAITVSAQQRTVVIDRGHSEQTFPITDKLFGVIRAEVTDRYLVLRASKRVEVFALSALPGAAPVLRSREKTFLRDSALLGDRNLYYLDDQGWLYWADAKSEKQLDRYLGGTIAVTADRKRLAIASVMGIDVYDTLGNRIAQLTTRANVLALAWSPDRRTLAVATRDGVELWTVPIDEWL